MDSIKKLQEWYHSYCDGEWEHQRGIRIGTIDNPGWSVEINLTGTKGENIKFEDIKIERSEDDWVYCSVKDNMFQGHGGSNNLDEILKIFLNFVSK